MTLVALLSSIVISSASLAWGYSLRGFGSFAVWVLVFGAGWLIAVFQDWKWFSWIGLTFATVVSAFGLWFGFIPGWMFAGGIFALFAWDMFDFRLRLRLMADDDDKRGIERRHILRISLLALIGMALASLTMLVRVQFTLEWSALLVIVALLGLGQLVGWLKK
ncbi:MAG: hypothetical protein KA473_08845 [Anaerolineales bacterium]|nr:hypothetical protein [Anaerolineales bacterium]MBP6209535.1 hypothetical protein [Anaerolineales bacterium]MBP8164157.1 hypothetical protein [Anaerolineales bacterium]